MMDMAEHDRQEAEAREAASAKVVGLHGQPVAVAAPAQAVIAMLREYLALAERGELAAVVVVGLIPNGAAHFAWQYGGPGTDMALCGAMDLAKTRMIDQILEAARPA